jgi:hypothetical protein
MGKGHLGLTMESAVRLKCRAMAKIRLIYTDFGRTDERTRAADLEPLYECAVSGC